MVSLPSSPEIVSPRLVPVRASAPAEPVIAMPPPITTVTVKSANALAWPSEAVTRMKTDVPAGAVSAV